MTDEELANKLLCALTQEKLYKADLFDYLCWLEETQQTERLPNAQFIVVASDGTPCFANVYADAVKVAMKYDKELYDAMKNFDSTELDKLKGKS